MADTEMQGSAQAVFDGAVDELLRRQAAVREHQLRQFLGAWLERQTSVIAAALSSLPLGMAPATQASNVVAALLAAADVRPPAEEPTELERLASHIDAVATMHSIGGRDWQRGMHDAARLLRRADNRDETTVLITTASPLATHYPGDGHRLCEGTSEPADAPSAVAPSAPLSNTEGVGVGAWLAGHRNLIVGVLAHVNRTPDRNADKLIEELGRVAPPTPLDRCLRLDGVEWGYRDSPDDPVTPVNSEQEARDEVANPLPNYPDPQVMHRAVGPWGPAGPAELLAAARAADRVHVGPGGSLSERLSDQLHPDEPECAPYAEALRNVLILHAENAGTCVECSPGGWCASDDHGDGTAPWPCPTVRALAEPLVGRFEGVELASWHSDTTEEARRG